MTCCRHCGRDYEATPHQLAKHDYQCPPCRREAERRWRADRKAAGRPVVSNQMPREYHRAYGATYYANPEVKARRAAQMRAYARAHGTREHHAARWKVQRALKVGALIRRPCEACGAERVHAHHDDYSRPLDVRWLCPSHHREHHAKAEGRT